MGSGIGGGLGVDRVVEDKVGSVDVVKGGGFMRRNELLRGEGYGMVRGEWYGEEVNGVWDGVELKWVERELWEEGGGGGEVGVI